MYHTDPLYQLAMFRHQIILKILSKITRPRNIGHVDIQGVPKNRAPSHIALVYFYLFANVNEKFTLLSSKDLSTAQYVIMIVKIKQLT